MKNTTNTNNVIKPRKFFVRVVVHKKYKCRFEYMVNSNGKAVKILNATCIETGNKVDLTKSDKECILDGINEWNGHNFKNNLAGMGILAVGVSMFFGLAAKIY